MADTTPRRRHGRPPLDRTDPSTVVSFRLPTKHVDALYRQAAGARMTVPELLRTLLRQQRPPAPR